MPVLKKPPVAEACKAVTIRLPLSVNTSLRQYADFLGCSLGHVVVEALKLVFKKDTEFQKWLSENPESESNQSTLEELRTAEQGSAQPINIRATMPTR